MYRIRIRESVIRGRGLGGVLSKSGKSLKRSGSRVLGLGYRKSRSEAAIEHKTQGAEKHRRSQCTEEHQWTQGWRRTCQDAMPASRGKNRLDYKRWRLYAGEKDSSTLYILVLLSYSRRARRVCSGLLCLHVPNIVLHSGEQCKERWRQKWYKKTYLFAFFTPRGIGQANEE